MTEDPPVEKKRDRRRFLLFAGVLCVGLLLLAFYLAISWVQASVGPPEKMPMAIRGGWLLIRPAWLHPVLFLVVVFAIVAIIVYLIAIRLLSRVSWREVVCIQADSIQNEVDRLYAIHGREPSKEESRKYLMDRLIDFWRSLGRAPKHEGAKIDPDATKNEVEGHVKAARHAAVLVEDRGSTIDRLIDAWTGAPIEAAFRSLHAAEVAMVPLLPDEEIEARIPGVLARLTKCSSTDPRRVAAEKNLRNGVSGAQRRAEYASALKYGYEVKDTEHTRVREFRNVLLSATAALTAVVAALCLAGASFPDALPLCFAPAPPTTTQQETTSTTQLAATTTTTPQPESRATTEALQKDTVCPSEEQPPVPRSEDRRLPAPGDVTLVALFGLLGGALSGAFAIRNMYGQSTPYGVPVALALLKLPSGALTAIVGILLVRGEFVPGLSQLDNQPQILAYAFFFGAAQQIATRFVDERAREVLGRVPEKAATPSDQDRTGNLPPSQRSGNQLSRQGRGIPARSMIRRGR